MMYTRSPQDDPQIKLIRLQYIYDNATCASYNIVNETYN